MKATKLEPRVNRIAGVLGVSSRLACGEDHVGIVRLDKTMSELPGVVEDGMSERNMQRKLGTARGSPRGSPTAKTSRISRWPVKSGFARASGGWGRLSDDGRDPTTRSRARTPGLVRTPTAWRCTIGSASRHSAG